MDAEVQQLLTDAAGPAPAGPDMAHIRSRADRLRTRHRRRRRGALAGLAAVAAGAVAAIAVWLLPGAAPTSRLKVAGVPTSMTPSKPGRWLTRLVPLGGQVQSIVLDKGAVYGVLASEANTETTPAGVFTVFRYDLGTGRLTKGPTLAYLDGITVAAGSLWAVAASHGGTPARLYRIDAAGLTVTHTWPLTATSVLPGTAVGAEVSAVPGGLVWAAAGRDLYAINPVADQVAAQRTLGGDVTSLSSSPSGRLLYLALQSTAVPLTVVEADTATATPIRQRSFPDAIAGGTVTAAPGGVWVTYRTGMAGSGVRLDANTLQTTTPASAPLGTTYYQTMGVSVSISDNVAWVTSATSLSCADPTTSAVRATTDYGSQAAPVQFGSPVATNHTLYAATPAGLAVIEPPKACFA